VRPLRSPSPSSRVKFNPVRLLLLAGVLIQAALSLGTSLRELNGVLGALGASALWRGANFSQGARVANYIQYLNTNIPIEGRVVLPPAEFGPKALATTPYMQFFQAPRQVINCTDLACAQNLSTENTYLLVVEDFPGEEAAQRFKERRMFNDRWGVLSASGFASQATHPGFKRLVDILLAACLPLVWLGLLPLGGHLLVASLAPGLPAGMHLSLGYGLGLSLLTAGLGLGWLLGLPLSSTTILGMTALLLVAGILLYGFRRRGTPDAPPSKPSGRLLPGGPWGLVLLLLPAVAVALSVGQAYSVSDEIVLWGAKGYGIAASGSLAHVQDWGTNTVLYPLHVPILIAAFKTLFAETLPASKLVFPGYYLALAGFAYQFIRYSSSSGYDSSLTAGVSRESSTAGVSGYARSSTAGNQAGGSTVGNQAGSSSGYGSSSTAAIAGGTILLLAASPVVFRHGALAYANLPLTFTLVGGAALLSLALQQSSLRLYLLSGLLLAAAAWTRPEGLPLAMLCILALLGLALIQRRRLPSLKALAALLAPLAGYGLFWALLKSAAYTQPAGRSDLLGNALFALSSGQWHLGEAGYILRKLAVSLFDPTEWGMWGIALLVMIGVYLRRGSRPRHPGASGLVLAGIVCLSAILGMYYLTSYDTNHDISWWLSTGLERMLLPAVWLVWLGLGLGVQPLDDAEHRPVPAGLEDDRRLGVEF